MEPTHTRHTHQQLSTFLTSIVQPVVHRNEQNLILAGVLRSTIAAQIGAPPDRRTLVAHAWFSWFIFNRQCDRWGDITFGRADRELARILETCAITLNDAAGPDATRKVSADEFELLLRAVHPEVSEPTSRHLAREMASMSDNLDLTITQIERKIAALESKRTAA